MLIKIIVLYPNIANFGDLIGNYTNLSSINCRMKEHQEGLINSMQALALCQLQNILQRKNSNNDEKGRTTNSFNQLNTITSNLKTNETHLSLNYYNLGVQQEYMRRRKDSEISYILSNKYCDSDNMKLKKKLNMNNLEIAKTTCSSKFSKNITKSETDVIKYNKYKIALKKALRIILY